MLGCAEREEFCQIIKEDSPRAHEMSEIIKKIISMALLELEKGKPERFSHLRTTLQLQQSLLVCLMQISPLPVTVGGRERWLNQHRLDILAVLSQFKCYCSYPQSLHGIRTDDYQWSRTPADFICLVLGKLHGTTPAQIRKLLSHRRSKRKTH